ncbi:MAG: hypothetical protein HZB38_18920 [Planctomycetes bacterium]|nr:hypothetical protein [Planctomycetota bacterium]
MAKDEAWRHFSLQIDTGAIITVLRRSAAALLGLELEAGDPIDLGSVGGYPHRYFVHQLEATIADLGPIPLRVAIAEIEAVPNLLGRLDVLDRVQIDLDVSLEETRFSHPWLDADDRRIWRGLIEIEATILSRWSDHPLPGRVDAAARRFVNQADSLVVGIAGLLKLHRQESLPLLIRSLFEMSVQFEYLMRDPEPRAALYLDYEHVTKRMSEQAWLKLPGAIGDRLRASPKRTEAELANKTEHDRVLPAYVSKKPGSQHPRKHWYPGTLKELALEVGRSDEYDAVYAMFSAQAHGDPWVADMLQRGNNMGPEGLWLAYGYWARLLTQIADAKKIILTNDAYKTITLLAKGITK